MYLLRVWHVGAAALAAAVLVAQANRTGVGWVALAVWPYGLSYFFTSSDNARSFIGTLVQILLMSLITLFVCSAFVGQGGFPLGGWKIGAITVVQAVCLALAGGFGMAAAKQTAPTGERLSPYFAPLVLTHGVLGLLAAGSVFVRPVHQHFGYFSHHAFDIVGDALLALLPYVAAVLFSWRMMATDRIKVWAYVFVLGLGTAAAVMNGSGIYAVQPGTTGVLFIAVAQLICFVGAAEWALDEKKW